MASKQNDLMLNIIANPHMNLGDFQSVGLSANNTSLEDEETYLNSEIITESPLFQNESGEFDKVKFHQKYLEASQALQNMAMEDNQGFQATYSKYNIFAPINQVDFKPQFELVQAANPDRLTKSMITLGQSGPREKTAAEIAQSQQVLNSETGEWMDTPEDMFSFNKLFTDFTGFFSDNFGSTKVLATYDNDIDINGRQRGEAGFNENLIEHYKGDYKLNDNGTYYYRTLKSGENIYGKQLLHYSDILTREGSALNAVDFLDSDDIQKSGFGSFVKNASLIGSFFLPYVGPAIAGATIFQQAAGLGATLGKIALGDDNSAMNWIEGLVQSTNPMETRSEYSQQNNWTIENLLGMVGDVVGQLYQQRLLFKYAPVIFKGKWGISEKSQEALKTKLIGELETKNKNLLQGVSDLRRAQKISTELHANAVDEAARIVEEYMKGYYKAGEELSKAYMTMLTVNDIYGEAKEAGAEDFDAALITAGYAAMEYALLSTDIGKWVLPELRAERLKNKAVLNALSKDTLESFKKLGKEATSNEVAQRTYLKKLVDFGKSVAKGEFASGWGKRASIEGGEGLLAGGFGSLLAGASAEAFEETSEELLADFSRVMFNGLEQLRGKETRLKPFENGWDRYSMSFLGGFLGGGISAASMDFSEARRASKMSYNQAMQEVIYKARNNQLDDLYKLIDSNTIGNNKLSAKHIIKDEQGNLIWKQAEGNDNQDFAIKQNLKRQLDLIQNTLDAHGGNLSDQSLLEAQTLRDIRFRALHQSTTAGRFIQNYNELVTELVDTVKELESYNSPAAKAENNEGDQKNEKSPELEEKRKKLEKRIKELDQEIENFTSGKLAPLFMTSALLESTPFISAPFMTSTFRYFAEKEAKTKFENIPEGELKEYLIKYQNYLRTSKKDDLKLATHGYLNIQALMRENFKQAEKLAQDSIKDPEIKDYIQTFTDTLGLFSQNLMQMDDDTWIEKLQEFAQQANVGDQLLNQIQLLRNTVSENNANSEQKRTKMIEDANQAFEQGIIDEETKNNTIDVAEQEYQEETHHNEELFNKQREQLLLQGQLKAAQDLADRILKLGYINGAIKSNIIGQLNSAINATTKLTNQVEEDIENPETDFGQIDFLSEFLDNISQQKESLSQKLDAIEKLPYTPILQNLDTFALNLNGGKVSTILEELGKQINTNRGSLSTFTLQGDVYKQVNEAIRTIDLYISALEGARIDTIDPFRVGVNAKGEAIDRSNIWGINKVLNEVHAKSPKIENDTWQDLPEISGEVADMLITDARSIKKLLYTYKRLYNINEGQKLNVQTRVATKASYLLYNKIKRILSRIEAFKDFNIAELQKTLTSLSFLEEQTSKDINDWNINLSEEGQIKVEKERIALEDALYNFFNMDNPGLATDIDKLKIFFASDQIELLDSKVELLSEGATDIDETSIIGYIASKAAIKSSDLYGKLKPIFAEIKRAPIISQELGAHLQIANAVNGNVITAFTLAYREVLKERFRNSDFNGRKAMLEKYGESSSIAEFFATEDGSKYYSTHDSVPQFTNITFIDGIPGAGKSEGVDLLVVKFLQKYYPDLVKNAWVCHGGDTSDDTHPFTTKFRNAIGLGENENLSFSKNQLMTKISGDWNSAKIERGKSYQIEKSDYTLEEGQITPTWKINNIAESEIPSIIIIDEAQQFTQFELMTIDKFARQHGISVIMSGDLQQSKCTGNLLLPKNIIQKINVQLKEAGSETQFNESETKLTITLTRNQVLHTPKLGTSMRTANNQKDANLAAMQASFYDNQKNITFHYFEDEENIAGDFLVNPNNMDQIINLIDKIIPHLEENEKINYAYDKENSKIVEALKNNKKYENKINFIQGTALGQEGNYWIFEPDYYIADGITKVKNIDSFMSDLYTGVSRSKIAGIIISPENLNESQIQLSTQQDLETHEIKYSDQAIEKYTKKRINILDKVLGETQDIEYIPRNKEKISEIPEVKKPTGLNPSTFEKEIQKLKEEGKISDTPTNDENLDESAVQFVEKGIQKIPIKGLGSKREYSAEIIDYRHRPIVVININGFKMPFYISTGLGGKKNVEPGKWYPFFGINPNQGWITKLHEQDINNFYGSPLLKAICDVLNSRYSGIISIDENGFLVQSNPYVNPQNGEEIPLTDDEYKPMFNFINENVGFGDRNHPNKTRAHIEEVIKELHEKAGYNPTTEDEPIIDPITNKEVQEVISDFDVADEVEAQKLLDEATLEDNSQNPDYVDEDVMPEGLSIDTFNFFLFSNATFELGTNKIDRENNTYEVSDIPNRIDGVNGLKNCPSTELYRGDLKRVEKFLGNLTKVVLTFKDKSSLEKVLSGMLGLDGKKVYVRYAIKTSEISDKGLDSSPKYGKLEKEEKEPTPYARAQQSKNSESNYANNRNLIAIIGTEENGDAIEIPLLTLNNPITLIKIHDKEGNFKFQDVYDVYQSEYDRIISSGNSWKAAQVSGLKAVLNYINNKKRNSSYKDEYKALENLIKLYLRTDRNIVFIPDQKWTPSNNLHSFGPQLHIHRGDAYTDLQEYDDGDYIQEKRWIPLSTLKRDPTIFVSNIYQLLDKSEYGLNLAQPKHPFVLYTDQLYSHENTLLRSDKELIKEYLWQKGDVKNRPQTIKLVYILPPKFTLREYVDSLSAFMDRKQGSPLGNQRTSYKILEALSDIEGTKQLFQKAFGEKTGEEIYVEVAKVVNNLKDKSIQEQIQELKNPKQWPNLNGVGLTKQVPLYKHLQHIIKQLVYPGGVTPEGQITLRGNGVINQEIFDDFNSIFEQSGKSLFYQTRASKNAEDIIEGIFSPIQTLDIENANIASKEFYINGNISSSTFLAEKEFNEILDTLVNQKQNFMEDYNIWSSFDNPSYVNGYSGWNRTRQSNVVPPTIDKSITDKLNKLGIVTNIEPRVVNDNSLELKQAIAQEINAANNNYGALVLPNGELIIGNTGKQFSATIDNNPFESNQQYQFDAKIGENNYRVIYNPITKEAEFIDKSSIEKIDFNSYYQNIDLGFIENNLERFRALLLKISETEKFEEDSKQTAKNLYNSPDPAQIHEFLNDEFGIMNEIAEINIEDFDKSQFIDILDFSAEDGSICPRNTFNVQFV